MEGDVIPLCIYCNTILYALVECKDLVVEELFSMMIVGIRLFLSFFCCVYIFVQNIDIPVMLYD